MSSSDCSYSPRRVERWSDGELLVAFQKLVASTGVLGAGDKLVELKQQADFFLTVRVVVAKSLANTLRSGTEHERARASQVAAFLDPSTWTEGGKDIENSDLLSCLIDIANALPELHKRILAAIGEARWTAQRAPDLILQKWIEIADPDRCRLGIRMLAEVSKGAALANAEAQMRIGRALARMLFKAPQAVVPPILDNCLGYLASCFAIELETILLAHDRGADEFLLGVVLLAAMERRHLFQVTRQEWSLRVNSKLPDRDLDRCPDRDGMVARKHRINAEIPWVGLQQIGAEYRSRIGNRNQTLQQLLLRTSSARLVKATLTLKDLQLGPQVHDLLVEALASPLFQNVQSIADALNCFDPAETVQRLQTLLGGRDGQVSAAAANAIGRLAGERVLVESLAVVLKKLDSWSQSQLPRVRTICDTLLTVHEQRAADQGSAAALAAAALPCLQRGLSVCDAELVEVVAATIERMFGRAVALESFSLAAEHALQQRRFSPLETLVRGVQTRTSFTRTREVLAKLLRQAANRDWQSTEAVAKILQRFCSDDHMLWELSELIATHPQVVATVLPRVADWKAVEDRLAAKSSVCPPLRAIEFGILLLDDGGSSATEFVKFNQRYCQLLRALVTIRANGAEDERAAAARLVACCGAILERRKEVLLDYLVSRQAGMRSSALVLIDTLGVILAEFAGPERQAFAATAEFIAAGISTWQRVSDRALRTTARRLKRMLTAPSLSGQVDEQAQV